MTEAELQMEWEAEHVEVRCHYSPKPFGYDIEATEFKIYNKDTGEVAAVLTLVDEHSWKVDIKLIQYSWYFQELSTAIIRAMDNYKVT